MSFGEHRRQGYLLRADRYLGPDPDGGEGTFSTADHLNNEIENENKDGHEKKKKNKKKKNENDEVAGVTKGVSGGNLAGPGRISGGNPAEPSKRGGSRTTKAEDVNLNQASKADEARRVTTPAIRRSRRIVLSCAWENSHLERAFKKRGWEVVVITEDDDLAS